jgi:oligopeptide transport system ATP-binding protein
MAAKTVLEIKDLQAHFHTRRGIVRAVDKVSFSVKEGQTLAIVGESGSGKSVCQLSYLRLLPEPPLKIEGGQALFDNGRVDLLQMAPDELRQIRGNAISMIFQEPMTSLNPYLRIGTQVIEPLLVHAKCSKADAWEEGRKALQRVGIGDVDKAMQAYPHEFSGGMRQRVMIAMALTTRPKLLIADEPTTALDVTVQAQILDLLKGLQDETGMAIIFISHDLGVVAGIANEVVVMYSGKVMEHGTVDDIFYQRHHPYTSALLKSTPRMDTVLGSLPTIAGLPPDLTKVLKGCPFASRCEHRMDICESVYPPAKQVGTQHASYCHLNVGEPRGDSETCQANL